ncbi:three-helix bundle dimerization domain-containing protein [Micrococcus porci]|uniref:three-helix bundle dimerization domain-containing protein n=1 Tax=Micrococcus porci TaxID=2856555 RepID=UPI003CE95467
MTATLTTQHHMPVHPDTTMQQRVLERIAGTLIRRFDGSVPAADVRTTVAEVTAELEAEARLTTYLPALTEREALNRLEAMAAAPAQMTITHARHAA